MRICSLLPSSTEILYGLGLDDQIVAVTHECDFPPDALIKPKVTRSEITPSLSSAEIDFQVRRQLENAGSLYELNVQLLDELKPDIIFTQQLCTVCAVSYENVYRVANTLSSKPRVINLEPKSLDGIFENILEVGGLTGVTDRAVSLVHGLQQRVERVRQLTMHMGRRKLLFLEWLDPPFCAGHWNPELIEIAGGYDALSCKFLPAHQLAWEQILSYNPESIVVSCCGCSVERTLQDIHLLQLPQLQDMSAIRNGNVFVVDGSAYFSRPGTRIIDSLEILATIVHPELFPFDYPESIVYHVKDSELIQSP